MHDKLIHFIVQINVIMRWLWILFGSKLTNPNHWFGNVRLINVQDFVQSYEQNTNSYNNMWVKSKKYSSKIRYYGLYFVLYWDIKVTKLGTKKPRNKSGLNGVVKMICADKIPPPLHQLLFKEVINLLYLRLSTISRKTKL